MRAEFLMPVTLLTLLVSSAALAADPAPEAADPAPAAGPTLVATMSGADEVDDAGKRGQGDPKGAGSFSARVDKDQLCYKLSWSKIDDPTMAHIHKGAAGANGPVYIGLSDVDGEEHCEEVGRDRLDAIIAHPEKYYVNIHNGDFPGGAVRGQLDKR